jgi:hypothetical protein
LRPGRSCLERERRKVSSPSSCNQLIFKAVTSELWPDSNQPSILLVFLSYGLVRPFQASVPKLAMRMFGEATGGILRVPNFLRAMPPRTGGTRISTSQLETVSDQVERVTLKARDLVGGHCGADLSTSLESASWSVAQCLDHLARTTNAFLPAISSAIVLAPRLTSNRALRTGALTRLFIRNLEPPYRLRFKVLAPLVPCDRGFDAAWNAFDDSQAELMKTIHSAIGLAVDQVRVKSPVYGRFSYNVYGALRMLAAHERRHLWQIQQILKALDNARLRNASYSNKINS